MKTGVYFCNCGANISGKIDSHTVREDLLKRYPDIHFKTVDFICSQEGQAAVKADLAENRIERVVVSACSPREHENTFMRTGSEFERILSSNGPTEGLIRTAEGKTPTSIAVVHCVGSLDANHKEYCSGICRQYAFKFNQVIEKKLPGTRVYPFYKELVIPGKNEFSLYHHARSNPHAVFIRYADIRDLSVAAGEDSYGIEYQEISGQSGGVHPNLS